MANKNVREILVPKETVSDDYYRVTELNFNSGDQVREGDIIGTLETSKADFELEAPQDGFIEYAIAEGDDIAAGNVFAKITDSNTSAPEPIESLSAATGNATQETAPKIRISQKAQALMDDHGLAGHDFSGRVFIREKDVRDKLAGSPMAKQRYNPRPLARGNSNNVVIVGDKGHAGACLDLLLQTRGLKCAGFIGTEDSPDEVYGYPVLGTNDELPKLFASGEVTQAVVGIGALANPGSRTRIYKMLKGIGYTMPNLIHPRSVVESSVVLGEGNQIFAGAIIGSNVVVGNNCIINSGAIISHDCVLHDNAHLTPGATLAGMVEVGENTVVGMNANVFLGVSLGSNVLVNNGVCVFKDIAEGGHA